SCEGAPLAQREVHAAPAGSPSLGSLDGEFARIGCRAAVAIDLEEAHVAGTRPLGNALFLDALDALRGDLSAEEVLPFLVDGPEIEGLGDARLRRARLERGEDDGLVELLLVGEHLHIGDDVGARSVDPNLLDLAAEGARLESRGD